MLKNYIQISVITTLLFSSSIFFGQGINNRESLSMGPGYANDIFYSFKNGEVTEAARDTWDIAFFTPIFSAGIIINEGNGEVLYTYPKGDTNAWATIDTSGMSGWTPMYNSPEYWEEGAFSANALGHPDYGWGWYNSVDHNLYGDSLYVLKTSSGFKKIFIQEKLSADNIYKFKFADLDGSNEQSVTLDIKPYEAKRFIYYSLENNEIVDREPEKESYDLIFTKYVDQVSDNEGNSVPYLVTGATNNVDIFSNNFYPVGPDFVDYSSKPFDSLKNSIGYDWKSYDFMSGQWTLKDSNYYFVKDYEGMIYKLQFISWEGSSTGNFEINTTQIGYSAINETAFQDEFDVYPNPAHSSFTIRTDTPSKGDYVVSLMDETGRILVQETHTSQELSNGIQLSDMDLNPGLYFISLKGEDFSGSQKLIVR